MSPNTERRSSSSVAAPPPPVNGVVAHGVVSYGTIDHTIPSSNSSNINEELEALYKSSSSSILNGESEEPAKTYLQFFRENHNFQLYLLSYIANHTGEWLTYLASLNAIESIQLNAGQTSTSGVAISQLVVLRLLPIVFFSPFGGVLADGRDRRKVMIVLDLAGAVVAWLYILAVYQQSIQLIYFATFLQQSLSGIYEPSRSAIIPLLVTGEDDLKKATTLSSLAWSVVAAFGCAIGGVLVGVLGIRGCYFIDSMTYLLSAMLMITMSGKYKVAEEESSESVMAYVKGMLFDGVAYVRSSFFGALVFMKASGALVWGGYDVLNVSFSERGSLEGRSGRLGLLFAFVGLGCWVGPVVMDRYVDMNKPKTLQLSCIFSLGVLMATGCILMGIFSHFWAICLFNASRSAGSSILWIHSSLLLQKFSSPGMLGRVLAMDYAIAVLAESFSAYMAGALRDGGISAEGVSLILGLINIVLVLFWTIYHCKGRGAAAYEVLEPQDAPLKELHAL